MSRKRIANGREVAEGTTIKFQFTRHGKPVEAFLARHHGRLVAYENVCRHLPLTLDYDDNRFFDRAGNHFVCQNHGALYDPASGLCVRGPCAGEKLRPVPIEVVNGVDWLATGPQRGEP